MNTKRRASALLSSMLLLLACLLLADFFSVYFKLSMRTDLLLLRYFLK